MSKTASMRRQENKKSKPSANGHASAISKPFLPAPDVLQPFLTALDPSQVYIVHVDSLPQEFKRKIFAVPVLLNIGIVAVLAWRLFKIWPTYLSFFLIAIGIPSGSLVDKSGKDNTELGQIVVGRTLMILFDFVLFRYIGAWPLMFFFEQPVSPALWRWKLGFHPSEVVVRVSRKWGTKDLWADSESSNGGEIGPSNSVVRDRILPAVDSEWMRERTGYMMMGKNYDLDLPAMLDAEQTIKKGEASYRDFAKAVYIHLEGVGWCKWAFEVPPSDAETKVASEEEQRAREKMGRLKEKLAALGKERLFFRWIELVQYESEQPGGLSRSRHEEILQKAKDMFNQDGIDLDDLLVSIGGIEQFPGLDTSSQGS